MRKVALITGITGQDGSFLAEFLLEKGYEVHGIIRRSSSFNTGRIEHLYLDEWVRDMKNKRLVDLHYGDMTDSSSLVRVLQQVRPTEIYNLAAQSHVKVSFDCPEYTAEADALGTLRLLEAVRILGMEKECRIYQASTSELYGLVQEVPQKETTPFYPRSPYGVAKQYGFWITKNYREAYGMFAVNGILFNHESERRGETFVYRAGIPGQAVPGEPGRPAGLGICEGLRGVHVADLAARHAGGFCHRHGGIPHGSGVHDAGVQGGGDRVAMGGERPGGTGR